MAVQLEDYFDFLAPDDIRIKGHRIGIETTYTNSRIRERGPRKIQRDFPTLTLEQVYATILYYLQNQEQVNKYLVDWLEYGRRSREEASARTRPFTRSGGASRRKNGPRGRQENHERLVPSGRTPLPLVAAGDSSSATGATVLCIGEPGAPLDRQTPSCWTGARRITFCS